MGARKHPKGTTTQNTTTNYRGAFRSYDMTPEEQELKELEPDRTLLDAGTKASSGKASQDIVEWTSGYAGIINPVPAARMQQIELEELADRESSALTAAGRGYDQMRLQTRRSRRPPTEAT